VGNDSHVAALAEYTYGHWNKTPNLLVVKIGEGIGSGIVLDGRLYYGDSYSSGEIGHISVVARGDDERGPLRRCTCGRYGCLETVSSTPAVLREAQRRGELISDELQERSLAPLVKRFTEGDSDCASLVLTAGRCLGAVIATLIAGLNIQKIIIAGDFYAFGEAYLDAVRGEAERRVLPGLMTHTQFAFSTLGADNVLLGVSALVMSQELGIP
jgi:predicted NBD/HSP70 family sugar kinase